MNPAAVIFDLYGTLLEVGPPPPTAAADWQHLIQETFDKPPRLSQSDFSVACRKVVSRRHELARTRGLLHPEVVWPSIVSEVLPEIDRLSPEAREEFIYRQIQTVHTTVLHRDAAVLLPQIKERGCLLGIASNAQAYTLRELRQALARAGLEPTSLFDPDLCFFSFEHGFGKPDPHVFALLAARLKARGISPDRVLLVGDRLDNDIAPARTYGWQTWWLNPTPGTEPGGDWPRLAAAFDPPLCLHGQPGASAPGT